MYLYDENKRLTEENDNIKSLNEKYLNELNAIESKINSLKEKAGLPSNYFSRTIEAYKFDTTVIE